MGLLDVESGPNLSPGAEFLFSAISILLCYSLLFLFLLGLYAGFISPMIADYVPSYDKIFSQKSRVSTIIASCFVSIIILGGVVYASVDQYGFQGLNPAIFIPMLWNASHYWKTYSFLRPPTELYLYIFSVMSFEVVMAVVQCIFVSWNPPLPDAVEPAPETHVFMIVAHNSSGGIEPTLLALLKLVRPHQIYIADNGSKKQEEEDTDRLTQRLSDEYYGHRTDKPINVVHISKYGNKTLAQYATIFYLNNEIKAGRTKARIVTMIDDDVIVPSNWSYKAIDEQFKDPTKVALAYPLASSNMDDCFCAGFQDIEYLSANFMRSILDKLGGQLFASGAIATWHIQPLLKVLERHCTTFNGEDLELGCILNRLSDTNDSEKLGLSTSARIGFVADCLIRTAVPPCPVHWYDLVPASIKRKIKPEACSCGEHSFFNQRLRSWDPASYQFFYKYLIIIFTPRGLMSKAKWAIRFFCIYRIIELFRDASLVVGMLMSFVFVDIYKLMSFYFTIMGVGWGLACTCLLMYSTRYVRAQTCFRPDMLMWYPIMFNLPMGLILKPVVMFYSLIYYVWFCRFKPDVRAQLAADLNKQMTLHTCWEEQLLNYPIYIEEIYYKARRRSTIRRNLNRNSTIKSAKSKEVKDSIPMERLVSEEQLPLIIEVDDSA